MNCFTFTCFQQGSTACVGKKARSLCLMWTSITHLKFVINDVLHGYGSDEHPSFTLDPLLLNYEGSRDGEMVEGKKNYIWEKPLGLKGKGSREFFLLTALSEEFMSLQCWAGEVLCEYL